ncbi:MAG: DUF11 domain-containing protein [Saprospiraceae bacterium]|nr:DUF11 domain-containing protein [Saprospiraceae bacterium]
MINKLIKMSFLALMSLNIFAQSLVNLDKAIKSLEKSAPSNSLQSLDLKELKVSDRYTDEHNGVEHIYFQQTYNGIAIYNAITSVHIGPDGTLYDSPNRFISDIHSKVNTAKSKIDALEALRSAIKYYKVENAILPISKRTSDQKSFFEKTNFTHSDIPYKLVYVYSDNTLKLAWDLSLELTQSSDYWNVRVDAVSGVVIDQNNYTVYCNFNHKHDHSCYTHNQNHTDVHIHNNAIEKIAVAGAPSYNVLPLPVESPIHGNRQLVVNPADPIASKFGWHTTKSDGSAEYTITRGNNVYAYLDTDSDNSPDAIQVNGGNGLGFDFPFDQTKNPESYQAAAITNLFYMCNMMHDITYKFGFTEVAGNFQVNTYGKGGMTDRVSAEAQDGSGTDNANFSTPADGQNGRMQMYVWNASSDVSVLEPSLLAGDLFSTKGNFGAASPTTPIIAEAVLSNDGSSDSRKGCKNTQSSSLRGKIAIIERGICEFGVKALYAQNAGAIAVIIYGFDESSVRMDGGASGISVTIPAYFIKASTFTKIKKALEEGKLILKIERPSANDNKPEFLDGDFDNGIIAHEYGHGISTRLTGGPANSGCLGNIEQMGEGWSDFFSLITTVRAGDTKNTVRGIGNYASSELVNGFGIRRRPYAIDMNINEFTYKDLTTSTHDIGEVWCAMLWDLYWALTEKYGFDANFNNKQAGNNIAIQLVMDGMKLQPCSPGFVDGRDAILRADRINNNGANQCLIWSVFARRGLGYSAKQGNSNFIGDEVEDFNSFPTCINATVVTKSADPLVQPGSEINYSITIRNMRSSAITSVKIKDLIPVGCTYINGSASIQPTQISANDLQWEFSKMDSLESKTITYKVKTNAGIFSNTLFIDKLEDPFTLDKWDVTQEKGDGFWFLEDNKGVNESKAFQSLTDDRISSDVSIGNNTEISIGNEETALLFMHKYYNPKNIDGGFVQISDDNGKTYKQIGLSDWTINPYNGNVSYDAIAIPKNKGFTGYTKDFIPSVLDLTQFKGKKIKLLFRYGNAEAEFIPTLNEHVGWTIDNIEIINPVYYNAEVCVATSLAENICTSVPGRGTLIDSKKVVATDNHSKDNDVVVFPNPTRSRFTVRMNEDNKYNQIQILTINGQLLKSIQVNNKVMNISSSDFPDGILLLKLIGAESTKTVKLNSIKN